MPFRLISPSFEAGGDIPRRHTCEGTDRSPPLEWSDPPAGTRSLALVVLDPDAPDPDAPRMTWVHWVMWDLPPDLRSLPEGVGPGALPVGVHHGLNDWHRTGWGGPCPPVGRHRYVHRVHALDRVLGGIHPATWPQLERAMAGHVLATAELVGTYRKEGR